MSIPDMNRRANQILEYICSMQVEIATNKRGKPEDNEEEDENEDNVKRRLVDAQMNEVITKVAAQMDGEFNADDDLGKENRRPTPILIPGNYERSSSPSSSLSSASTIPLDDDRLLEDSKCNGEKSIAEEALEKANKPKSEQSSMEIMDSLTRQVITFQRRFGSLCYNNLDDCNESDGPPVTRSREIVNSRSMTLDSRWSN